MQSLPTTGVAHAASTNITTRGCRRPRGSPTGPLANPGSPTPLLACPELSTTRQDCRSGAAERRKLKQLAYSHTAGYHLVVRARIVRDAAHGCSNAKIASRQEVTG
jgi:hypothetical protein